MDSWAILLISPVCRSHGSECEGAPVCESGNTSLIMLPVHAFPVGQEAQSVKAAEVS